MKAIQLKIEDNRLETFLTIINNLKKDMIQEITISDIDTFSIPTVSDTENEYYANIISNMNSDDKIIASEKSFTI